MEWAVYRTIPFDVYVLKQLWILHDFLGNFCNLDWLMTVVFFFFFQQEDLQEMQKYGGVPSRKSDVGLVVIRDVSAMMPIHQSLGQAYTWVLYTKILMSECFIAASLYGFYLGLLGQFTLVTYPTRTGGKRPHFVPWTTWPEKHWPRGKVPYWSFWVWAED